MNVSLNKSKLGGIGENMVQTKLMQLGLNVVNANTIIANYEAVDLICSQPGNKKNVYIQVKTCRGNNFPIGMTLAKCTKDYLERKVKGPWVFVHVVGEGINMEFQYYILTREEMIALASESNFWYINQWKKTYRLKPVNLNSACGIDLKWLRAEGEDNNYKHEAFINPITANTENKWEKILDEFEAEDGINVILGTFTGVTDFQKEDKENELARQFMLLAKKLLYGGYFLVNERRRIYLEDIEFYYHEEQTDGLKDPAMYHTSDHEKRDDLPYFILGSMNCHVSGIDITFENQVKEYRASFLIRGYRVESLTNDTWTETKKYEKRATYIYEDLMMGISLNSNLTIGWVNEKMQSENYEIGVGCRINVPAFIKDENGRFVKDGNGNYMKEEIGEAQYNNLPEGLQSEYFSYSGKRYRKCNRPWRFYKK